PRAVARDLDRGGVAARRPVLPALRLGPRSGAPPRGWPEGAAPVLRDDVRAEEPLPGDALLPPALLLEVDDLLDPERVVRRAARGLRAALDARHRLRSGRLPVPRARVGVPRRRAL